MSDKNITGRASQKAPISQDPIHVLREETTRLAEIVMGLNASLKIVFARWGGMFPQTDQRMLSEVLNANVTLLDAMIRGLKGTK